MPAAAIVVAGVLAAGATIYASNKSSSAAEDAANKQAGAARSAAELQNQQYLQTRSDLAPWRAAGETALNRLSPGMQPGGEFDKFQMSPLINDPSYQFRLQEGRNQLLASGAAAGNYGSGNMGVALEKYGQNLASQEYQNEYARQYGAWQDQYNRLAGIAGTGQTTATQLGQMGLQSAANQGNMLVGGANALAAGQVGAAQAQAGGLTGVANQFTSGLGTYLNYQNQQQFMNMFQQQKAGEANPNYFNDWNANQWG